MTDSVQTAVVGVTGYAGAELARLLLHHPRLKGTPPVFAGRMDAGEVARGGTPLGEIHPELADSKGSGKLRLQPFSWELLADLDVQVLFLATPHEQSRAWVPEALARGLRVIDLSGAWRLNEAANRAVYNFEDEGLGRRNEHPGAGCIRDAGTASGKDRRREPGRESGLLCDVGDSRRQAPGRRRYRRSRARHCRRCEKRRERSRQGAYRQDPFHVRGRQSLRLWVFSHRHTGELLEQIGIEAHVDHVHAASAADSARHSCPPYMCGSRQAQTRAGIAHVYHSFFAGSPMVRLHALGASADSAIRCAPITRTSDFNSLRTDAVRSSSVVSTTC